jgi:hypothetical protein
MKRPNLPLASRTILIRSASSIASLRKRARFEEAFGRKRCEAPKNVLSRIGRVTVVDVDIANEEGVLLATGRANSTTA